ncbi:MAG: DUF3794 domain-containing protein [Halanaerobiales bacterium]|nr:DUF3794 domain-containing protein [Halanaerobiales bacterium]
MFELFVMLCMMMGFLMSSLYFLYQWQETDNFKEVWSVAGNLSWLKALNFRPRNSPTITREELEGQYIKMMQNRPECSTTEGGGILEDCNSDLQVDSNIQRLPERFSNSLPERGSNMFEVNNTSCLELVKVPVVVGENTTQQMLVTDLCLDFCAIKVRDVQAKICDLTVTVITDKVIVQGILHKQIFFVDENNVVRHQSEDIPFSFFVDVPGAEPSMDVQIHPVIEHISTELICDGCVLHQKVVIEFFVKVTDTQQIFVEVGEGPLVKLERVVGENSVQTLVPNSLELPIPAIKVVDIDAEVRDITCEVIQDKVIIQGIVHKQVFFIDTDDIERHIGEDVPFSTFVDVPGAEPGNNCQIHPIIEFIKHELSDDGTILDQEIVLEIFVKITETVQLNLVIGDDILLKIPEVIGENVCQILLENVFELPICAIKIKEIDAVVKDVRCTIIRDKVIIQGIVHKQIYFIDEENIERHQSEDVPFSTFVDVQGAEPGMDADINPVIEFVKPELDPPSTLLRQKIVLEIFVKVTQTVQIAIPEIIGGYDC